MKCRCLIEWWQDVPSVRQGWTASVCSVCGQWKGNRPDDVKGHYRQLAKWKRQNDDK